MQLPMQRDDPWESSLSSLELGQGTESRLSKTRLSGYRFSNSLESFNL